MEGDLHTFKKLAIKRFPRVGEQRSGEESFWKKLQFPVVVKEFAPVTSLHFSASPPHDFAVTSGARVQVYNCATNQSKKTISRFQECAYHARFRGDGRLLVAGSEEGIVKVFDIGSRAILRQFSGHKKPVKAVCFTVDGLRVVSGSDDTLLQCWDLSTSQSICTLRGHQDYIKTVVQIPTSSDLLLSASYDHSVCLWDLRSGEPVTVLDHGLPVEAVLAFPSGGTCVSAGGNYLRVWDLLSGGRPLAAFSNHQKTITCLCFDGSCQRIISGGLDKQVKAYSVEDYSVVQTLSYPSPVLSVAMSPTDTHLVVGMTTNLLSIRHQAARKRDLTTFPLLPSLPQRGTYRYFVRGRNSKPKQEDVVVEVRRRRHLKLYEEHLKKFNYRKALDAALTHKGKNRFDIVYDVLQELARRDGLVIALSKRSEEELHPVLKFLTNRLLHPQRCRFLIDVANIVTDLYGSVVCSSKSTRAMYALLKVKLDREVQFQKQAMQLLGLLDTILLGASKRSPSSEIPNMPPHAL